MRFFPEAARWWQAATICLSLAAPALSGLSENSNDEISTVAGSTGPDSITVNFKIPCDACFGEASDALDFEVTIPASAEDCGTDFPIVNGIQLLVEEAGHGQGIIFSRQSDASAGHDFLADWTTLCLNEEGSLLSLNINQVVGGETFDRPVGFTLSYHQESQPRILRVRSEPTNLENNDDFAEQWLHPSDAQRLRIVPPAPIEDSESLELEYQKLEELKARIFELHSQLHHQEGRILRIIKNDFKACRGVRCVVQTAMRKIPDFTYFLATHFRIYPKPLPSSASSPHQNCSRAEASDPFDGLGSHFDELDGPTEFHVANAAPSKPDLPHPPDPPFKPHKPHKTFSHSPLSDGHSPPNLPHRGSHHHRPRFIGGLLAILVLLLILSVRCMRHGKKCIHRKNRRRGERAARREERRARRAHRWATRRQEWSEWWNRFRRPTCTTDYEEKRNLILQQEQILENAMQNDINTLRTAHELAEEMMHAEEGRARLYYQANLPPSRPTPVELDTRNRRDSSTSYISAPPTYEEELEGDMTVVDGFSYTPSGTDETPDSSVVDCSPRLSFETSTSVLTKSRDSEEYDS